MRYVIARQPQLCVICKETIEKGKICIQSQGWGLCFYHEKCHAEKYGNSIRYLPKMTKTVEDSLMGVIK